MSMKRFWKDISGGTGLIFALSTSALIVTSGVAVDISALHNTKMDMQASLDSAMLAAARSGIEDNDALQTFTQSVFDSTFSVISNGEATLSVSPISGALSGQATLTQTLLFGSFLGASSKAVSVNSTVSYAAGGEEVSTDGKACVSIVGTDRPRGLTLNGGADVRTIGCEIHVHTERTPAVSSNHGVTIETDRLCVAATSINNNGPAIENLETGCAVTPNPYVGLFPEPDLTCTHSGTNYNGGEVSLTPGVYCGSFNFNGSPDVTLAPGTYVIKDRTWNVNGGSWSGDGVTFYFAHKNAKIQFNSDVSVDIKAPATGDYAGVVMLETDGLQGSNFVLNPSEQFLVEGLIYLPSRKTILNSQSSITGRKMNLVVNELMVNGAMLSLVPVDVGVSSSSETTDMASAFPIITR